MSEVIDKRELDAIVSSANDTGACVITPKTSRKTQHHDANQKNLMRELLQSSESAASSDQLSESAIKDSGEECKEDEDEEEDEDAEDVGEPCDCGETYCHAQIGNQGSSQSTGGSSGKESLNLAASHDPSADQNEFASEIMAKRNADVAASAFKNDFDKLGSPKA